MIQDNEHCQRKAGKVGKNAEPGGMRGGQAEVGETERGGIGNSPSAKAESGAYPYHGKTPAFMVVQGFTSFKTSQIRKRRDFSALPTACAQGFSQGRSPRLPPTDLRERPDPVTRHRRHFSLPPSTLFFPSDLHLL